MSTSLLTLRDAFVNGLKCVKRTNSVLTPIFPDQIDALIQATSTQTVTYPQLASAALLFSVGGNVGMNPIKGLKGDPLNTTCFQFGQGRTGWYFCYAHLGDMAFTFMLFRIEMAPPSIVKKMNIPPPEACLYGLTAGYGTRDGAWVTLPNTIVQGQYLCADKSFSFTAIPNSSCPWLTKCNFGLANGVVKLDLEWNDLTPVGIKATFTALKPPVYQGEKGCMAGACVAGSGTLYWSYTSMTVDASVGNLNTLLNLQGTGWFDHQWLGLGGGFNNKIIQLISNVESFISTPNVIRWFWLTMQLPNDLQYMIFYILPGLPISGKVYDISAVKIRGNTPTYNLKGKAVIESTVQVGSQIFPTRYSVTLEGVTYTLQSAFGKSVVYLPKGILNWEGPGDVFDSSGKQIGVGFLEGNQLLPEDNLIQIPAATAGVEQSKYMLFRSRKFSCCTGLVSIILLLMLLFIILGGIIVAVGLTWKGIKHLTKKQKSYLKF